MGREAREKRLPHQLGVDVVEREDALVQKRIGLRASKERGAKLAKDMAVLTGGHGQTLTMVMVPRTIETTSPSASVVSAEGSERTSDLTRNAVALPESPAFRMAFLP